MLSEMHAADYMAYGPGGDVPRVTKQVESLELNSFAGHTYKCSSVFQRKEFRVDGDHGQKVALGFVLALSSL
jgi:hypothetical protein